MSHWFIFLFVTILYPSRQEGTRGVLRNGIIPITLNRQAHSTTPPGVQVQVMQERAVVSYYDPKYVKEPKAFTGRARRGEPYRSNMTGINLHPWGNNVTFTITMKNKYLNNDILITMRICDMMSVKWVSDFLVAYTDLTDQCPIPAGFHGFYNIELPPKNFPISLPKGNMGLTTTLSLTNTKVNLLQYKLKTTIT